MKQTAIFRHKPAFKKADRFWPWNNFPLIASPGLPKLLWIISIYCCMISFSTYAQAPASQPPSNDRSGDAFISPGGMLDTVLDRFGNKYSLRQIMISGQSGVIASQPAPGMQAMPQQGTVKYTGCNSGYFQLYLESGSGLENFATDPAHQARLNVFCQVLQDLSAFINSPLASTGQKVNIWVRDPAVSGAPSNFLGAASSFYNLPSSHNFSGIGDNTMWLTLQSGKDAYTNVAPPLTKVGGPSASGGIFFHGVVFLNFNSIPWHTDLTTSPSPSEFDLYSVILHEMMHALGFHALLTSNGNSRFGYNFPYFTRYDLNLKTSAGQSLLTHSGSCASYSYGFNTALSTSVLAPNPANCITNNTTCSTAIKYYGSLTTAQAVYTPNCWEDGSSLSHFEDQCTSYGNDQYFLMCNAGGTGTMKRYPKPEERLVLCDIGYNVNISFGNASNLNYYGYGGTACPGLGVAGINDGISSSGTYTYVATNGPATINGTGVTGLLANDYNATSFECLQEVFGPGGTFNVTSGTAATTVTYTPPSGYTKSTTALLRYIPVNNGKRGNITYVYVFINNANCVGSPCAIVKNGGLESGTSCGKIDNPATLDCWVRTVNTPDMYTSGCSSPFTPHPGSGSNTRYMGLMTTKYSNGDVDVEGVQTTLNTALTKGVTYKIGIWAKVLPQGWPSTGYLPDYLRIGITDNPVAYSTGAFATDWPAAAITLDTFYVNDTTWRYYTDTFTYNSDTPRSNLLVYNAGYYTPVPPSGDIRYMLWDDISIEPLNNAIVFSLPDSITYCQDISDLSAYVSVPGGTFSGPGVTSSNGIYSLNAENAYLASVSDKGIVTITYTYTDANGCTKTLYDQVKMVPGATCCLSSTIFGNNPYTVIGTSGIISSHIFKGNYYIKNNVTINGDLFVDSAIIAVAPGVTITIPSGSGLSIYDSHIFCCSQQQMWNGIVLKTDTSTGELWVIHSLIEDAVTAVHADSFLMHGLSFDLINVYGSTFNRNGTAFEFKNCNLANAQSAIDITEAVITSRDLSGFNNYPYNWPQTLTGTGALKTAYTPANPYLPPYNIDNPNALGTALGYPRVSCKIPSLIRTGISLTNIGHTTGAPSSPSYTGLTIGITHTDEFIMYDNLNYGINMTGSNATAINNTFMYMQPTATSAGGIGISAVNIGLFFVMPLNRLVLDDAFPTQDKFYNCYQAVYSDNYYEVTGRKALIISDHHNNTTGTYGYNIRSYKYRQIDVSGNYIYNTSNGIYVTATSQWWFTGTLQNAGTIHADNNVISAKYNSAVISPVPFVDKAIYIQNILNRWTTGITANGMVTANGNTLTDVNNGIAMTNFFLQKATSNSNNISVVPSAAVRYGISHTNCVSNQINSNTVSSSGTLFDANKAIICKSSSRGGVSCNVTNNIGRAFEFVGNEPGMMWQKNNMTASLKGLMINTGYIGQQGGPATPIDDRWNGAWGNISGQWRYHTYAFSSKVTLSTLFVNSGTITTPAINASNLSSACPNIYRKPPFSCAVNYTSWATAGGCSPNPGLSLPGYFDQVANNQLQLVYEPQKNGWTSQFGMWQAMLADSTMKDSSAIMHDFYNIVPASRFKYLTDVEDKLASEDFAGAQAMLSNAASLQAPGYINGQNGAIIADIPAADNIVSNYVNFYNLYLKYQNNTMTPADQNSLATLASLCPFDNGTVVYQARALYNVVFNVIADWDDDHCIPQGEVYFVDDSEPAAKPAGEIDIWKNVPADQAYVLYPSPGNGDIHLYQRSTHDGPVKIAVYNTLGMEVYNNKVNFAGGNAQLSLKGMAAGVYILKIEDNSNAHQLRFVIE